MNDLTSMKDRGHLGERFRSIAVAVLLIGLITACAGTGSESTTTVAEVEASTTAPLSETTTPEPADTTTASTPEPRQVNVQVGWLKNVEFAGLYAADKEGYLAEVGISQEVAPGGPNLDPIQLLASGAADIATCPGTNDVILARANGIPLKAFAAQFQKTPSVIMSMPDNPITSAEDLVGKRIGLQPTARPAMDAILIANDIQSEDVEYINVADDPTPLVSEQVDGFMAFAFSQPIALELQGIETETVSLTDLGYGDYVHLYCALEERLDAEPELFADWLVATQRGWQYFIENTDEMIEYTIAEVSPDLDLALDQQSAEAALMLSFLQSDLTDEKGLLWMNTDGFERGNALLVQTGQIEEAIPIESMVDLSILGMAFPDA